MQESNKCASCKNCFTDKNSWCENCFHRKIDGNFTFNPTEHPLLMTRSAESIYAAKYRYKYSNQKKSILSNSVYKENYGINLGGEKCKILSWNMQGSGKNSKKLNYLCEFLSENIDIKICLLQEFGFPDVIKNNEYNCKIINQKKREIINFENVEIGSIKIEKKHQDFSIVHFSYKNSGYYMILFGDYKGRTGSRNNDACIIRDDLVESIDGIQENMFQRPTLDRGFLGLKFIRNFDKLVIGSFHANASSETNRKDDVVKLLKSIEGNCENGWVFIVGGDFNLNKFSLEFTVSSSISNCFSSIVCSTGKPTQKKGDELDHFLVIGGITILQYINNKPIIPNELNCMNGIAPSDHCGIVMEI